MKVTPTPVHETAERLGLPLYQPEKIRTEAYTTWLAALQPDLFITAAYGRILTPEILAIPKYGCLNIHASLLPKHRGASPVHASVMQGDTQTGITIMLTDVGMDTGDILYQETVAIPPEVDAGALSEQLSRLGAARIVPVVDDWVAGAIQAQAQNEEAATYTRPMTREDGRIDWLDPAAQIHNLVRGTSPWPGAFTKMAGKRVKIHATRVAVDPEPPAVAPQPGMVVHTCPTCIRVACGDGSMLEVLSLQAEACKRLSAKECFHNFHVGAVFGEV